MYLSNKQKIECVESKYKQTHTHRTHSHQHANRTRYIQHTYTHIHTQTHSTHTLKRNSSVTQTKQNKIWMSTEKPQNLFEANNCKTFLKVVFLIQAAANSPRFHFICG